MHILLAPAKIGAGMFAAESYTSRHYIAIVAMACLCVLGTVKILSQIDLFDLSPVLF